MASAIIRWLATFAAVWNGAFLAYEGLWIWPRTIRSDPWVDSTLLLIACFLPILGAILAIFRPRQGSLLMITAIAVYVLFCAVRVVEDLTRGEHPSWDGRPFYMFVIPSTVFAVAIFLSTRRKRPSY